MATVISLVSAKGSPGVTTVAAALAAAGSGLDGTACWVELDPSGGSGWLRSRASCPEVAPTLAEVARELREPRAGEAWTAMASAGPPGILAVLAPTAELAASTVIAEGPERWGESLSAAAGVVVVDAGRWDRGQALASRIAGSDLVGVVCRATVESVEHTRHWVAGLHEVGIPLVAVVVGSRPYAAEDVAHALGLPLAGAVEWRPSDVAALWSRGAARPVLRSWLGRSAAQVLASLLSTAGSNEQAAVEGVAT